MANKGSTCSREGCDKAYHACSSCDMMNWEHDYCSAECHEASKREAFERISKKYGIDISKMDDLFSDLSEWVEHY